MNSLEACIMSGAGKARIHYERMTGGYWLSHAPESFLQVLVALEIERAGYAVYIDTSIRKMKLYRFQITLNGRRHRRHYPNTVRQGRIRFKPIWDRY
jgi:hypothetical protein